MQAWKIIVAVVGTLAFFCSTAHGQSLVVETWNGSTMQSQNTYSSGAAFTIPLTGSPTPTDRINLYSTGGLASIGTISFSGSTSASIVDVIIGSGTLNTDLNQDIGNGAQNWGGASFPFNSRRGGTTQT